MIRCYYNSRKVKAMNTKQVTPKGILYTETNDKFYITKEEPFSRLGWMTPSQQRWSVIPTTPTGKRDQITNHWIYLPERTIVCSNPTIMYEESNQITVYVKDNPDE